MHRVFAICLLSLLSLTVAAWSQQAPTTGTIEGIVVRVDTGEPIASAQVTITSTSRPSDNTLPVVAGPDGRYSFRNLKPDTYRVFAAANGFVRQEYGQFAVYVIGRPVFLADGQTVKDATIRLTGTGAVTGRISDENGQPATGAPIQLLRAVWGIQGRNFTPTGTATADDRGNYRIYGVPPGRYVLLAGSQPGSAAARGARGAPGSSTPFSPIFYPNAADSAQAMPVDVKAGGDTAADMSLRRQTQTYRVKGRVIDPVGAPLSPATNVVLAYRGIGGPSAILTAGRTFDPVTGIFEFQNVMPGDYSVQAQVQNQTAAAPADRPFAHYRIRVVDKNIEDVVLVPSQGASTTGRIVVDGQPISSIPNLERLPLRFLIPSFMPNLVPPEASAPAADGSFKVIRLREGEYTARPSRPAGYYVKSATYAGSDVLAKPFNITGAGVGMFEVTLRKGVGEIVGTVVDSRSQPIAGIPVYLIPAQRSRFDLYQPSMTDASGRFALTNIAPGDYKLFSWEAAETSSQFDPDFMREYEQRGQAIHTTESSMQTVELKMIPAPR